MACCKMFRIVSSDLPKNRSKVVSAYDTGSWCSIIVPSRASRTVCLFRRSLQFYNKQKIPFRPTNRRTFLSSNYFNDVYNSCKCTLFEVPDKYPRPLFQKNDLVDIDDTHNSVFVLDTLGTDPPQTHVHSCGTYLAMQLYTQRPNTSN